MAISSTRRFESLNVTNYRLFWIGGALTNSGRWAQIVTTYYITFQLTNSATWIGIAAFAHFVPMVIVNPLAGWISDNLNRRRLLISINLLASLMAASMAFAWVAGLREPSIWVFLFFLNGAVSGFKVPVGQAFVAECVPQSLLRNAITLNSTQFNAARALGPALGGLILGTAGVGWTLAVVVFSYGAMLLCLVLIKPELLFNQVKSDASPRVNLSTVIRDYKASVKYVLKSPGISSAILTVSIISTFGFPVVQQIVVFAEEVFEVSPFLFGLLGSAQGIGAILAVPIVAGGVALMKPSTQQSIATVGYGLGVLIFALAPVYEVAFLALGVIGIMHLTSASNLNSVVQLQVDDEMRGRVMAIYIVGVLGPAPFANLAMGWLISLFGPRTAVATSGCVLAVLGLLFGVTGRFRNLDTAPENNF